MKDAIHLTHEFVEYIPKHLKEGTIYISTLFATAAHKCCCGCGQEVITPLSPTDWKLIYDGESISLDPSIGNWNFPCQSHYWITRNTVSKAPSWSIGKIKAGRDLDRQAKQNYFENKTPSFDDKGDEGRSIKLTLVGRLWRKLKRQLFQ